MPLEQCNTIFINVHHVIPFSITYYPLPYHVLPHFTARGVMGFGDLKSERGVTALNGFLEDKSYIEG